MLYYQVIEFNNIEPLKIGAGGNNKQWAEPAKDYIPGSTIRGAVISQMLRQGVFDNIPAILQDMECYNAYPYESGKLYFPMPQHLRVNKHEYRRAKMKAAMPGGSNTPLELYDLSVQNNENGKNTPEFRYVAIKDDQLTGKTIGKSYRLHQSSSLNKGMKEKANLFSYQAIEPGHIFRAIIAYQDSVKQQVETVLKNTNSWYLGGSKGSGYGHCRSELPVEATVYYEDAKLNLGLPLASCASGSSLILTCLSDALFRNEYGQPVPYMPEEAITEICGHSVKRKSSFIDTGITEGYNATWRSRYPKETTLKAGSILTYTFDEPLDEREWQRTTAILEERLNGLRTQDGFGWLAVNMDYPSQLIFKGDEQSDSAATTQKWPDTRMNPQEAEVMRMISKGLGDSRSRWLYLLCEQSWNTEEGQKPSRDIIISDQLKRHQLGIMMDELKDWKPNINKRVVTDHKQAYRRDEDQCSVAGISFDKILEFLYRPEGEAKSSLTKNVDYSKLLAFAEHKLNTRKGLIYFDKKSSEATEVPAKRFIAELLLAGLQIRHRERDIT
ncbi:hypothetical protein [Paenibacillus monticola]|uniref:hypothetical protein n=1 Tax=Paenibacillus monticola TaxID=2666075 RepID=UPI0012AD179E|nr:hypothetical protein [Paenibacillus monticola]